MSPGTQRVHKTHTCADTVGLPTMVYWNVGYYQPTNHYHLPLLDHRSHTALQNRKKLQYNSFDYVTHLSLYVCVVEILPTV